MSIPGVLDAAKNAPVPTRSFPDGRKLWLYTMLYTWRLVIGRADDNLGYDDAWCYDDFLVALRQFENWDPLDPATPEPEGWIRHPRSGRRRRYVKGECIEDTD